MKPQTLNPPFQAVFISELSAITGFYGLGLPELQKTIAPVNPWFEHYWEMVFSVKGFELITAGNGSNFAEKVAQSAAEQGLSGKTIALFNDCCEAFPAAIVGIKFCFAGTEKPAPTLYVRTKTEIENGLKFLSSHLKAAEMKVLQEALSSNKTLYGLGFSEKGGRLYVKTYTIEDVTSPDQATVAGFVSHRLHEGALSKEHKTYLPEVSLYEFHPDETALKQLRDFLVYDLQYSRAGHIGLLYENDQLAEYKIYVERAGGIPTDFTAR